MLHSNFWKVYYLYVSHPYLKNMCYLFFLTSGCNGLNGFKSTQNRQNHVFMTSSRDCDVMSRDQNFQNYFMTHGKRLSITQYKPHLSTVFSLCYTCYTKLVGNTVSIYISISLSSITHKTLRASGPKTILVSKYPSYS